MPETTRYLNNHVIEVLRREIQENGGRELFAILAKEGGSDLYNNVAVVCRGTDSEVPALVSRTRPNDMTVHNHPSGILQPSPQDMNMATLFGEEGVGSMIINNDVSECIVVAEPHEEPPPVDVDEQLVARYFAENGALAKALPNYEHRESQSQMAAEVARAINRNEILAVEAGTGTGKSLAYLLPAFLWTKHNKSRVVIATKTIALQEQLVFKDIPLARRLIPDAPKASLVKGRNNYVCLRKINDLKSHQLELFDPEEGSLRKEIEDLSAWVEESGSGDRADLPFVPTKEAWDMVRSDADMCLGSKCPFFQKAPFYDSRRQAAQAKVLVVNQALLFSDLALRSASGNYKASAVIPPYEHIILDEAHSVEDIATDHFGEKISSFGLRLTLGKFLSSSRGNKGMLHRLFHAAVEHQAKDLIKELEERAMPEFRELQEQVTNQLYALSTNLHNVLNRDQRRQVVIWMRESLLKSGILDQAKIEAKALLGLMHELMLVLRRIRVKAKGQSEAFRDKMNGLFIEMEARQSRLENTMSALKNFAISLGENQVPWLELRKFRKHDEFEYKVSPLDVSGMLRESLFTPFKSVIMTSATLELDDDFRFLSSRNGLREWEDKKWSFNSFKSPFDYSAQAKLFLVRMGSDPNQRGFPDDLADLILKTVAVGGGGTLVLFTSYQLLYMMASRVEDELARMGIDLLVQGRASRSFLVERLKKSHGVLFGTDSFWEGIDLPGDALTKLIITKLPFRQMGDPIFEARCASLESQGRSSFNELSLPLALLKFKQGVGRLIRHKTDQGVLIVADNRIRTKGYGQRFLTMVNRYPVWDLTPEQVARAFREHSSG